MITYYPNDSNHESCRLDHALKLCQAEGRALNAGEYADVRIADNNNALGHWDRVTFVNSWRIASSEGVIYVHRPLFTPDEFDRINDKPKISSALDLRSHKGRIEQLFEEGKRLEAAAKDTYAPRDVWYLSPDFLNKWKYGFLNINEVVPFLNGKQRAIDYLAVLSKLTNRPSMGFYFGPALSKNRFTGKPLVFEDDYDFLGAGVQLHVGRFVGEPFNVEDIT